jgi:actin-related protein
MDTLELTSEQEKLLQVVLETLTVEQLYQIASRVRDICTAGWGEVRIVVDQGHPYLMLTVTSEKIVRVPFE